jgi:hypothetical protein
MMLVHMGCIAISGILVSLVWYPVGIFIVVVLLLGRNTSIKFSTPFTFVLAFDRVLR